MITATQCRMARAALGWTTRDLGERSGASFMTIVRFEKGGPGSDLRISSLRKLEKAFADAGFVFPDETSVQWDAAKLEKLAA
jgi:transcriptional regulator with XRE-family HTH domain